MTRGADIQRIVREGKRIRAQYFEVRVAASPSAHDGETSLKVLMRVGLIVPRYRRSTVDRNRIKRQLRELARLQILPMSLPLDVVIRIHPEAYQASYELLTTDVRKVVKSLTSMV